MTLLHILLLRILLSEKKNTDFQTQGNRYRLTFAIAIHIVGAVTDIGHGVEHSVTCARFVATIVSMTLDVSRTIFRDGTHAVGNSATRTSQLVRNGNFLKCQR